tara:strand:+ start:47 stop:196 length:150 start_codon:yes stop_codon:yes gene_type:complete
VCICVARIALTTSQLRKIVFFSPWAPVFLRFAAKFLGFGPRPGLALRFF